MRQFRRKDIIVPLAALWRRFVPAIPLDLSDFLSAPAHGQKYTGHGGFVTLPPIQTQAAIRNVLYHSLAVSTG